MEPRVAFEKARDCLLKNRNNYAAACKEFKWPRLEEFNWALDWFDYLASGNQSLALLHRTEEGKEARLTFRKLSERSGQVANFLTRLGVQRGDRILLMLPNIIPLWEVMLGAMKIGAVVVPSTVLLSAQDVQDRVLRGGIQHVVTDRARKSRFAGLQGSFGRICVDGRAKGWTDYGEADTETAEFSPHSKTRASDPLLLYFTSGTTSKPKLVMHTHESYPVGHLSTMYWIGLRPGDRHLNISSPGWAKHAWSSFFAPWNAGATLFVYEYERFNAGKMLKAISNVGVTTLCAPPTVWRLLIQEKMSDYPVQLREIVSAGEPLNPSVIEAVEKAWGVPPRDGFGQTESTAVIGNTPSQRVKLGSMGRPLPGYHVSLLDFDGRDASEGQIALDLSPRPCGLMRGYLTGGELQKLDDEIPGSYLTGDIASRDSDGYYTYVGRTDDVFKSSDYRISPFELESVAVEHPAIAEAAVVPSPHPTKLYVPKVFISLAPGNKPSAELATEIFRFLRGRLSPFKRVRRIQFGELPKTVSGKIRRVDLRRSEEGRTDDRAEMEFWEEDC